MTTLDNNAQIHRGTTTGHGSSSEPDGILQKKSVTPPLVLAYTSTLCLAGEFHFGLQYLWQLQACGLAFYLGSKLRIPKQQGFEYKFFDRNHRGYRIEILAAIGTIILQALVTIRGGGFSKAAKDIGRYSALLKGEAAPKIDTVLVTVIRTLALFLLARLIVRLATQRSVKRSKGASSWFLRFAVLVLVGIPLAGLARGPLVLGILTLALVQLRFGFKRKGSKALIALASAIAVLAVGVLLGLTRAHALGRRDQAVSQYIWAEATPVRSVARIINEKPQVALLEGLLATVLKPFPRSVLPSKGFSFSEQVPQRLDPGSFSNGFVEPVTAFGAMLTFGVGVASASSGLLGWLWSILFAKLPVLRLTEELWAVMIIYPMLRNGVDASLAPVSIVMFYAHRRTKPFARLHPWKNPKSFGNTNE